jgi:hypothetical protein
MDGPTSRKTKEPLKKVNHKSEHQVPEPLLIVRSILNRERGGPLERIHSLEEPSLMATSCFKIEIACTRCNAINTLYL